MIVPSFTSISSGIDSEMNGLQFLTLLISFYLLKHIKHKFSLCVFETYDYLTRWVVVSRRNVIGKTNLLRSLFPMSQSESIFHVRRSVNPEPRAAKILYLSASMVLGSPNSYPRFGAYATSECLRFPISFALLPVHNISFCYPPVCVVPTFSVSKQYRLNQNPVPENIGDVFSAVQFQSLPDSAGNSTLNRIDPSKASKKLLPALIADELHFLLKKPLVQNLHVLVHLLLLY